MSRADAPVTPIRVAATFLASSAAVALATVLSWLLLGREHLADAVMVHLLATVVISMRFGYGPSIAAAGLSVLSFNLFFIPPYYTLSVADPRHFVTFAVMFVVAVIICRLTKRIRDQAEEAVRLADEAHRAKLRVETEQLRNALLSSVSHDLRTPLAIVTGSASTLLDEGVDVAVKRELTETILQESDRLNRLVQNLLDMTRVEAGALQVRKDWQSIEDVVGAALGRVEKMLVGRNVGIDLQSPSALVPLDAILIEQVLVNLLENAVKYTPSGSPITVRAAVDGPGAVFEVLDAGPGIPPNERGRVFEKFYRGREDGRGAGLGLAICRGIVVAHGGRISLEANEENEPSGARFRFVLPIDGEPPTLEGP